MDAMTKTLPTPVGGFGFLVDPSACLARDGWRGVQGAMAGALALIDGARGGDAVAWCGLVEGAASDGETPASPLAVVLTWSTDAVGPETVQAAAKALSTGLGSAVHLDGPAAPAEGFFPSVAILGGVLHRVRLPQDPDPVVVWAAEGLEGLGLFGASECPPGVTWIDAVDVVLARREEAEAPLDRDEALFLVHAAGRLAQVTDPAPVIRWMQRRLGPILAEEGLLHDDGRIDTDAVREAVTDALEALRSRPAQARQALVHRLAEPLAAEGGIDEASAREIAVAMAALGLVPETEH